MDTKLQPTLKPVLIATLRPTQITVGLREVAERRRHWRRKRGKSAAKFLGKHMIPVVLGPGEHHYLIDNHHLARALYDEGVKSVLTTVVADLRRLDAAAFWFVMDNRGWLHPFDERGRRLSHTELANTVGGLRDDPFRSLAGELRRAGGFAKETMPFAEFLWADFLRRRMKRKLVLKNFNLALKEALTLAKSDVADYLPGWCGPAA
ncbi:MAG: chromosome partitioning protein ParB [Pseudomonadota bacterium]|nr:chromosome partitioning protein ParB [Pseudomonadota bacterium]